MDDSWNPVSKRHAKKIKKYKDLDNQTKRKCKERMEEWVKLECEKKLEWINTQIVNEKVNEIINKKGQQEWHWYKRLEKQ